MVCLTISRLTNNKPNLTCQHSHCLFVDEGSLLALVCYHLQARRSNHNSAGSC